MLLGALEFNDFESAMDLSRTKSVDLSWLQACKPAPNLVPGELDILHQAIQPHPDTLGCGTC